MASFQGKFEVVENWEDADESELLSRPFTVEKDEPVTTSNGHIMHEDTVRSQYTPPEPSVKILKRPAKGSGEGCPYGLVNGDRQSGRSVGKSLEQRQLDYAEARLRILGEAKSPEDELDERLSQMNFSANAGSSSISSSNGSSSSPSIAGGATVTLLRPCNESNLVRHPRGSDGTRGFTLKR